MILFDLDGTLADCSHRRHFVDPEKAGLHWGGVEGDYKGNWVNEKGLGVKWKPNWKAFFDACDKDTPIEPVINFIYLLAPHHDISIWSGRCESTREKTMRWLHDHAVRTSWIKELKMRPVGDSTPDDVLKEKWLDESYEVTKWGSKTPIDFVFDDRPKVVRMWQRRGIFVFNVSQTGEEF